MDRRDFLKKVAQLVGTSAAGISLRGRSDENSNKFRKTIDKTFFLEYNL